jgi:hypothetical protein
MAQDSGIKKVMNWVIGIASISLVVLILLIIFGNLSTNLGFATDTAGYNNTEAVINNVTSGVGKLVSQFPTALLFAGIALLLFILIAVLGYAIKRMSGLQGGSNKNFE